MKLKQIWMFCTLKNALETAKILKYMKLRSTVTSNHQNALYSFTKKNIAGYFTC